MDAFLTAFRVPNLLRDLLAEGALSTVFVTLFSKKIVKEGEHAAWSMASRAIMWVTILMSVLVFLGIMWAQFLVRMLAPGFSAEKAQLTTMLCRIIFPFVLLVSIGALVSVVLNVKNVFGVPAIASSFFNLGFICGGMIFGWILDPSFSERSLVGLAIGSLIGGTLQLAVQLPPLRKAGFSFRPHNGAWRDPADLQSTLTVVIPAVLAASTVQANVIVNSIFASWLGDGPVSWLSYAFRLMQFPLGVFGVAVATVTSPIVSQLAVTGEIVRLRKTLASAMRLAVFLTLPSAIGLILLALPVVSVVYQHGKFGLSDTFHTATALQFYSLGLVSYSCIKVLFPAFYAIDYRWTPVFVGFFSIGMNLFLNWLLILQLDLGYRGLAVSTAFSAGFNFVALYWRIRSYTGGLESVQFASTTIRTLISALSMAVMCWYLTHLGSSLIFSSCFWIRSISLFIIIFVSVLYYLGMCWLLRIEEMHLAVHACMHVIRAMRNINNV